jgi:hypothetical protein
MIMDFNCCILKQVLLLEMCAGGYILAPVCVQHKTNAIKKFIFIQGGK